MSSPLIWVRLNVTFSHRCPSNLIKSDRRERDTDRPPAFIKLISPITFNSIELAVSIPRRVQSIPVSCNLKSSEKYFAIQLPAEFCYKIFHTAYQNLKKDHALKAACLLFRTKNIHNTFHTDSSRSPRKIFSETKTERKNIFYNSCAEKKLHKFLAKL